MQHLATLCSAQLESGRPGLAILLLSCFSPAVEVRLSQEAQGLGWVQRDVPSCSAQKEGMGGARTTGACTARQARSGALKGAAGRANSCVQWPQEGCGKGEQEQGVGGRRCSAQGTRLKGRYSRSTASSHSAMSLVLDTLAAADSTNCLQWGMFSCPRRAASCATGASPSSRSVRSCLR